MSSFRIFQETRDGLCEVLNKLARIAEERQETTIVERFYLKVVNLQLLQLRLYVLVKQSGFALLIYLSIKQNTQQFYKTQQTSFTTLPNILVILHSLTDWELVFYKGKRFHWHKKSKKLKSGVILIFCVTEKSTLKLLIPQV